MMSSRGGSGLARAFQIIVTISIALTTFAVAAPVQAQTFQVISTLPNEWFSSQLTMDQAGNLYGVTANSGENNDSEICEDGCGAVFELYRNNSQWELITLYTFLGVADGFNPQGQLAFGPDGLYGTTLYGGFWGFGTVYSLTPLCKIVCNGWIPWTHKVLYSFLNGNCDTGCDGRFSSTPVTFDHAGNLYGITEYGGFGNNGMGQGTIFELSPAPRGPRVGKWQETQLHAFGKTQSDGTQPQGGLLRDDAGNLYGTTLSGGDNNFGTVYQLAANGRTFTEVVLHSFNYTDGAYPQTGLIADRSGNLYGATYSGSSGGTVFELSPSGDGWTFSVLYDSQPGQASSLQNLAIDAGGNLYGVGYMGGQFNVGAIFKLTPTENGWVYTSLHDFTGGLDGEYPESVYLDASGNLYGSAHCGTGCETSLIWMITPN
jgi:uncharacterized repeat protein (TIGR03803 family)